MIDVLRGACFVFMTVDHFPGNPFFRFSNTYYGPFGFFTAALGFIFLSGVVAGLIYDRHRATRGMRSMTGRILRRVRDLYITQMAVFLVLVAVVAIHLGRVERWDLEAISNTPWKGLLLGSFLLYDPDYLGILPMYCFFLFLTPIVLWQFKKGNLRYVLGLSLILWLSSGLLLRLPDNTEGVDLGPFNPLGYQFLFIIGLAFGTGEISIERLSPTTRKLLIGSCLVLAAGLFVLRQQYALHGPLNPLLSHLGELFSGDQLGPLRFINFAAFGVVVYWLSQKIEWGSVRSRAFGWLAFVGRHSLPVFAWSIVVAYVAIALLPRHPSTAMGFLGVFIAVSSLTIPAYVHAIARRGEFPFLTRPSVGDVRARTLRRAA